MHFKKYMIDLCNSFLRVVETCTQNIPKGKDHYLLKSETSPEIENGKHPLKPFAIGMHFLRNLSK